MQYAKELKRTKALIASGRYQRGYSKELELFKKVSSNDTVKINQVHYQPYFYAALNQLVFGQIEKQRDSQVMHFLYFTNFDYHYGIDSPYLWFDKDDNPFDYLD